MRVVASLLLVGLASAKDWNSMSPAERIESLFESVSSLHELSLHLLLLGAARLLHLCAC